MFVSFDPLSFHLLIYHLQMARSDMDAHQLQYLCQGYLDAVHSKPQPRRQTQMTDALRTLSCRCVR